MPSLRTPPSAGLSGGLGDVGGLGGILDSMPDGIIVADADGRIVSANTKAEELFGYPRGELRGKPVEVLLPGRLRAAHAVHRHRYAAQPRVREMGAGLELLGLRRDGTEFPVEIRLSPLDREGSQLFISAVRDITQRKRIERELHDNNQALTAAAQAKDLFLATMSHELRTPLNAIIGFTSTLLMRLPGPLNAEQEKQLRTVQVNGRHLLALINDILDLAKIESGKIELSREPVSVSQLLREAIATVSPAAREKNLNIRLSLPRNEVILHTDPRALTQVILNLLSNAIKFTSDGEVCVRLRRPAKAGAATIAIEDTGMGISAEDQLRLFNAFARLGGGRSETTEGTGLGLHLSRRLAELLGGTISLVSQPGKGSVFKLAIPLVRQSGPVFASS